MSSCVSPNAESLSLEGLVMLGDEFLERHPRPSSDLLDEVIRAREQAVLVIDWALPQVLDQERVAAASANIFLPPIRRNSPRPTSPARLACRAGPPPGE
jgi:hypothetical protein